MSQKNNKIMSPSEKIDKNNKRSKITKSDLKNSDQNKNNLKSEKDNHKNKLLSEKLPQRSRTSISEQKGIKQKTNNSKDVKDTSSLETTINLDQNNEDLNKNQDKKEHTENSPDLLQKKTIKKRSTSPPDFKNSHLFTSSIANAKKYTPPQSLTPIPHVSKTQILKHAKGSSLSQKPPLQQFSDNFISFSREIEKLRQLCPPALVPPDEMNMPPNKKPKNQVKLHGFANFFHKMFLFNNKIKTYLIDCRKIIRQRQLNIEVNEDTFNKADFFRTTTYPQYSSVIKKFSDKIHPLYNYQLNKTMVDLISSFNTYVDICYSESQSRQAIQDYEESCKNQLDEITTLIESIIDSSSKNAVNQDLIDLCIEKIKTFGRFVETELILYARPFETRIDDVLLLFHQHFTDLTQMISNVPKIFTQYLSILKSEKILLSSFAVLCSQIGTSPQPFSEDPDKITPKRSVADLFFVPPPGPPEPHPIITPLLKLIDLFKLEKPKFSNENDVTPDIIKMAENSLKKNNSKEVTFSTNKFAKKKEEPIVILTEPKPDPRITAFKTQDKEITNEYKHVTDFIINEVNSMRAENEKLKERLIILEPLNKKDAVVDRLQQIREFKEEMDKRNRIEQENFKLRFVGQLRSLVKQNDSKGRLEKLTIDQEIRNSLLNIHNQIHENDQKISEANEAIQFLSQYKTDIMVTSQPTENNDSILYLSHLVVDKFEKKNEENSKHISDLSERINLFERNMKLLLKNIDGKSSQNSEQSEFDENAINKGFSDVTNYINHKVEKGKSKKKMIKQLTNEINQLKTERVDIEDKTTNLKQALSTTLLNLHGRLQYLANSKSSSEQSLPSTFEQTTNEIELNLQKIEKQKHNYHEFLKKTSSLLHINSESFDIENGDYEKAILEDLQHDESTENNTKELIKRKGFYSYILVRLSDSDVSKKLLMAKNIDELESMVRHQLERTLEKLNSLSEMNKKLNEELSKKNNKENDNSVFPFETSLEKRYKASDFNIMANDFDEETIENEEEQAKEKDKEEENKEEENKEEENKEEENKEEENKEEENKEEENKEEENKEEENDSDLF